MNDTVVLFDLRTLLEPSLPSQSQKENYNYFFEVVSYKFNVDRLITGPPP